MYYGTCLCGEISVEILGSIDDIIHCHCSLCRKNSGTAYATNGFINANEFRLIDHKRNWLLTNLNRVKIDIFARPVHHPFIVQMQLILKN